MNENTAPLDYLTTKEAALFIRSTQRSMATARCQRRFDIPFYKVGSKILYKRSDLEEFLAGKLVNPADGR